MQNEDHDFDITNDLDTIIRDLHTNAVAQGATEEEARTAVDEYLAQHMPELSQDERERRIDAVVRATGSTS